MTGIRGQRIVFDPAHAAEAIIYFVYGRIPIPVTAEVAVQKWHISSALKGNY
jgi:hypothetical protein